MKLGPDSPRSSPSRDDPPTFDLTYRFDDAEEPTEVTVFPAGEVDDPTTTWLTIDAAFVVSLPDAR